MRIGDRQRFAVEVGEFWGDGGRCRRVDLWAAGRRLTCDDNNAYLPQFCADVRHTIRWLGSGRDLSRPDPSMSPEETHRRLLAVDDGSRIEFWFPQWGPTTDNVSGHIFREGDRLAITLEFWREVHEPAEERGRVFVAELPEVEFVEILEKMLDALGYVDPA